MTQPVKPLIIAEEATQVLYVSPADLQQNAVVWQAIKNLSENVILDALVGASAMAESYLTSRYKMPFLSYGPDFKRAVRSIAIYDLMSERGHILEAEDENFRLRYKDALAWLKRVNEGQATPAGIQASNTGNRTGTTPRVRSNCRRGF